jgi:phosphoribosylformylglycinamidine synthase
MYVVGETTGDMHLKFADDKGLAPIDLQLAELFGNPPKTVMNDVTVRSLSKPCNTIPRR